MCWRQPWSHVCIQSEKTAVTSWLLATACVPVRPVEFASLISGFSGFPEDSRESSKGFLGGSDSKDTYNAGDLGSIPGSGRSPGEGHGNPLPYSCLENPHGQRSLASYSPQDCKESDMIKRLSTIL